jgi:hypothetical protein
MFLNTGDYNMRANNENKNITITFNEEEALVLLDWLSNFNEEERPTLFQDQAEQRILWDIEAVLEKVLSVAFDSNYQDVLSKARQQVRDKE